MVDDPIAAHYELCLERDRLFRDGEPRLEFSRTKASRSVIHHRVPYALLPTIHPGETARSDCC